MEEDNKKIAEISNSIWSFFVEKRTVAWLFIVATVIGGLFSAVTLPREIQPEISIPIGGVSVFLPGANPEDTESLITEPLEKEIATISNIKNLTSSSGFGSSTVMVEFETSADIDQNIQDLKDAVDRVKSELPEDATEPTVIKAEANEFAIITFSIIGNRPLHELTKIAEDIEPELEKISGVSKAVIVGGQEREIQIIVDKDKLDRYGLTLDALSNIIDLSNTNLPLGVVSIDKLNYSLRVDNRYTDIEEIRNIPIFTATDENKSVILLKDIAKIQIGYPQQNVITKLSENGKDSLPAISIQIFKKEGGNILKIVEQEKAKIDELKENKTIPQDISVVVSNDNSVFIKNDLGVLTSNGIQTTILIIILLFLSLGLREGFIAGLSVPLSFLITFIIMDAQGLSINSLSLFSLVIALGIMVDTSIVIMQGIHKNIEHGFSPKDASLLAIQTYKWPLIAGNLTTIFAFFPMLLVSGIVGEFLKTLPIVISAALLSSLFLGLTIIPAFSSKFLKENSGKKMSLTEKLFDRIGRKFYETTARLITKRSYRISVVLVSLLLFLASLSLPISGLLKVEMFPQTDQHYFIVRIEGPIGALIEDTEKTTNKVEEILYKKPYIDNFLTIVGSSQSPALTEGISVGGGLQNSNIANITVNLVEKELREQTSYEIAADLEKTFDTISEAKISVSQLDEGPPSGSAITVRITGKNLENLNKTSEDILKIIKNISGTKNVESSLKEGLNEFKFTLDRDLLSRHGLSAIQVAATIRSIIQGQEVTTIKLDDEDIDIIVKYELTEKNNRQNLIFHEIENFEIPTPFGYSVSLGEVGKYYFGPGTDTINREDQKRIVKVNSEIDESANSIEITQKIQSEIDKLELPDDIEVGFGGDFEDVTESFNDLFRSMIVGIILIAFCIVLEFNSFRQTLIIMMTLPLALIGVFPGLLLLNLNLSFPAFLGVVALAGVVVNNAIVMIDRINESRANGMEFAKAITEATYSRLEPIFMTTLTTIVGIIPLAMSNEFWAGLGYSLAFGLGFSTLLTLFVIPILYYSFEKKGAMM